MKQISTIMMAGAMACGMAAAQTVSAEGGFIGGDGPGAMRAQVQMMDGGVAVARISLMGPPVKNAPYTADGVTEMTRTLGDGTHINRQETYTIYRDSEGRIRRESGDRGVWISDPVANVSYVLDTEHQTAHKLSLARNVAYRKMQSDISAPGGTAKVTAGTVDLKSGPVFMAGGGMNASEQSKSESLGTQEMEGVEVEGTRTTVEVPQGQIGNDRPLQIVSERWVSPELHITVLAKHTDPMMGDSVERLTNIRRDEPDPALFQVPAGYTIESDKSDK